MTGISTLGQALSQLERIKDQQLLFNTLSTQLATGKKTQEFAGLGTDVLVSKRARADFQTLDTYLNNITIADRRINLMLNAIDEFKAQAEIFANAMINLSQESVHQEGEIVYEFDDPLTTIVETDDPTTPEIEYQIARGMTSSDPDADFEILRDLAANVFDFMVDLLNAQDGDRYLLGGSETLTEPLGSTSSLTSAVNSLLTGWKGGTITTDELIADLQDRDALSGNPDALTDTIIGYSASLSAGNVGDVYVRVAETTEIEYTALANDQGFRDILVAAAYMMNETLPPIADTYEPPNTFPGVPDADGAPGTTLDEMKDNFFQVFNELTAMVNGAIDQIDSVRFKLENARARIDSVRQSHEQTQNLLLNSISDVEDVDVNEVAIKLNTLQVSLDASFRVTARLQELSLVNFF